ncbi:DUF1638 domain-containing protein [Denitromonas iodatirespirans]|uniref:DUF1638 domain-containing protein n=1 Tax=Denitromonas iodatirespirans TaxID=2795389 RepID=A0A944HCY5_DENI1|nr:DUF1638 domain-containing protein [Denitromonas iodatirespirans]MBT0961586.1 DUF1638 domain-containing protein [Denitromonas iodatirespirans]
MAPALIIACGALARELTAVIGANGWQHVQVQCLPAELHNRPEKIPEAVRAKIHAARGRFAHILVAYADCGTGGLLDRVLEAESVERLPGAHCYEFYAGTPAFMALADAEPGSFYLTDFLVRHFDRLVIRELGIERHPELASQYFGNYRRLVYLAQHEDAHLRALAEQAAERLGLAFEYRFTGYGDLERSVIRFQRGALSDPSAE